MRVLVLWADNRSANLGVRVLAQGASELIRAAFGPETEIVLQDFAGSESGIAITPASLGAGLTSRRAPLARFVDSFDLVVDTGAGDSFADIYGSKRLVALLGMQQLSRRLGIPHILGPQTVGPFDTWTGRRGARYAFRTAVTATFARDSSSLAYARELGARDVTLATDTVFALPRPVALPEPEHDVLLNVSGLLWSGSGHVDPTGYRQTLRGLIDRLLELDRGVALFSHVLDSKYADNDVPAAAELSAEYAGRVGSVLPSSLEDARLEISRSRVVIASRMHAALNAVSQGVAAVPLAYSRKFQPLFADLGIGDVIDLRGSGGAEVVPRVEALLGEIDRGAHVEAYQRAHAQTRRLLDDAAGRMRAIVGGRHG